MPWWKRPAKLTGKNHERFMWRVQRARVYTHLNSRKKYSPLHTVLVSYWFSKVLSVKALKSKPSHTAKRLWRVGESKPSHRKNVGNQEKNGIKHYCGVKALKSNPSHSKLLNIRRNEALCERVNTFLGIKRVHPAFRVMRQSCRAYHHLKNIFLITFSKLKLQSFIKKRL